MKFSLYSLDRSIIEDFEVREVIFPGLKGETSILPGHAPLLSQLQIGELRFQLATTSEVQHFAISHGFIKVEHDTVVACSYTVEPASEIDIKRAVQAQKKAESRLQESIASTHEFRKHELKLQRAMVRQQVASKKQ